MSSVHVLITSFESKWAWPQSKIPPNRTRREDQSKEQKVCIQVEICSSSTYSERARCCKKKTKNAKQTNNNNNKQKTDWTRKRGRYTGRGTFKLSRSVSVPGMQTLTTGGVGEERSWICRSKLITNFLREDAHAWHWEAEHDSRLKDQGA